MAERDQPGREMESDAKVWREYTNAAGTYDDKLLEGWNSSTDVILIFAALFSAVITAFLIDTYKQLQPNSQDQSLVVLKKIAATLSGVNATVLDENNFAVSNTALWVNGLWFTSLTGSLAVGSLAMLIKQWIRSYRKDMNGSAEAVTLLRQRRYDNLQTWGVPHMVASLPLLLSVSLIEFFIGLSIFLYSINHLIGWLVIGTTIITLILHVGSLILPAVYDCPYKTAASPALFQTLHPFTIIPYLLPAKWLSNRVIVPIIKSVSQSKTFQKVVAAGTLSGVVVAYLTLFLIILPYGAFSYLLHYISLRRIPPDHDLRVLRKGLSMLKSFALWIWAVLSTAYKKNRSLWLFMSGPWRCGSTESVFEHLMIQVNEAQLKASAILWLIFESPEPGSPIVALQSLAGIYYLPSMAPRFRACGVLQLLREMFLGCVYQGRVVRPIDATLYARAIVGLHMYSTYKNKHETRGFHNDERYSDSRLLETLSDHPDKDVAITGIIGGEMVTEMVTTLERHSSNSDVISEFNVQQVVAALGEYFSRRSRWNDHDWEAWSLKSSWDKWVKRIVPTLVKLLSTPSKSKTSGGVTDVEMQIGITLAVFTHGLSLSDLRSQHQTNILTNTHHHRLTASLASVVKYSSKYGIQSNEDKELVHLLLAQSFAEFTLMIPEPSRHDTVLISYSVSVLLEDLHSLSSSKLVTNILKSMERLPNSMLPDDTAQLILKISLDLKFEVSVRSFTDTWAYKICQIPDKVIRLSVQKDILPLVGLLSFNSDKMYASERMYKLRVIGCILYVLCDNHDISSLGSFVEGDGLEKLTEVFSQPFAFPPADASKWMYIISWFTNNCKAEIKSSGLLRAFADSPGKHFGAAEMLWPHRATIRSLLLDCSYHMELEAFDNALDHQNVLSNRKQEAMEISHEIDCQIEEDSKKLKKEVKILLLGGGEGGKSTVSKQIKILHQNGYSGQELESYRTTIYRNLIDSANNVIRALEIFKIPLGNEENQLNIELICQYRLPSDPQSHIAIEVAQAIHNLWCDPCITTLMERSSEFYLMDNASYFFNEAKRIGASTYVPNEVDILHSRSRTREIQEYRFKMGQLSVLLFDVGGQRGERKKWTHCFESVTCMIFCTALSEYNQTLLEESSTNRMAESLHLFEAVINSRWFSNTSCILFLNKIDIFTKKISQTPLERYFPEYAGGSDVNKATKYVLWKFMQMNKARLTIYPHVTKAIDTNSMRLILAATKETILQNALQDSGIL